MSTETDIRAQALEVAAGWSPPGAPESWQLTAALLRLIADHEELLGALAYWRRLKKDIKEVWERGKWDDQLKRPVDPWEYQVQKPKLAEALWPVLKAKIEAAQTDPNAPVPQIAQVIMDALLIAQRWRHKSFVLTAVE